MVPIQARITESSFCSEQTAECSLGTCCSVTFKPVCSQGSNFRCECRLASRTGIWTSSTLQHEKGYPSLSQGVARNCAQPRFLFAPLQHLSDEIRHFSRGGKLAAAAPKQTRGQLSSGLRLSLQQGGTVEPVWISFPLQFCFKQLK